MIMIVKTPGSQLGSPAAADEGGEEMGGEKCESGERSEVQAQSTVASTVSKARSRSREVVTFDEEPRISLRVSTKLPSSSSSSMSTVISQIVHTRLNHIHRTHTDYHLHVTMTCVQHMHGTFLHPPQTQGSLTTNRLLQLSRCMLRKFIGIHRIYTHHA